MNKFLIILLKHILSIAIYAQTADEFRTKANNGDAYSQYALGWCYFNGKGVAQDHSQAFQWFLKSAEKNYPPAQHALGLCYKDGIATTKNYFEAFSWLKKAADQKHVIACRDLGMLYFGGLGTEKDSIEGQKYLLMAAEQNDMLSLRELGHIFMNGLGTSQNIEKGVLYYQKASDLGDDISTRQLAHQYAYGVLVHQDIEKAKNLLLPLVEKGDESAIRTMRRSDFGLEKTEKINDNTFALVISNMECQNYLLDPSFYFDAMYFNDFCKISFGIPEKHIHRVMEPTFANLIKEFDWLSNVMNAYDGDANIILYYAGPGISDESTFDSYILPADGDATDTSSGLSLNELYETLSNMPSKSVLVIIDACFNGTRRDGEMITSARGVKVKAKPTFPKGNIVVFNASQKDETAWKVEGSYEGLFTNTLLNTIKEAQGDITLGELSQKVITKVKRQVIVDKGVSQTPIILASPELGNNWMNWKLKP